MSLGHTIDSQPNRHLIKGGVLQILLARTLVICFHFLYYSQAEARAHRHATYGQLEITIYNGDHLSDCMRRG